MYWAPHKIKDRAKLSYHTMPAHLASNMISDRGGLAALIRMHTEHLI
jgi:hypothetical protein